MHAPFRQGVGNLAFYGCQCQQNDKADLAAEFGKRFPQAKLARGENEILEDSSIQLVLSSAIPDQRAPYVLR